MSFDRDEKKEEKNDAQSDFDLIYQYAKEKNKEALKKFITLNVRRSNETPISLLAKEGDEESVKFLLEQGASPGWAIRGAAAGGHEKLVAELRKVGASLDWAIGGAALGGHEKLVAELREAGASLTWAIQDAALGGHEKLVTELREAGASLDPAIKGAAQGGHEKLVAELRKAGASLDSAIYGAALGGHEKLVAELRKAGASLNWAIQGAEAGSHEKLAVNLIKQALSFSIPLDRITKEQLIESFFQNEKSLLHFLVLFNNDKLRKQLVSALRPEMEIRSVEVVKANQINKYMREKDINFEQALALITPEVKGLFTNQSENDFLPDDLMALTASFLTPASQRDLADLYDKEKHLNLPKLKKLIEDYDQAKGPIRKISGDQKDIKALKQFYQSCLDEDKTPTRELTSTELQKLYKEIILPAKTKSGSASDDIIKFLKNSPEIKSIIKKGSAALQTHSLFPSATNNEESKAPQSAYSPKPKK